MSWLAAIDRRALNWPRPARVAYTGGRWLLIGLGVYLVGGLAFIELGERRVGLGTGATVAVILGTIKGLLTAASRSRRHGNP